VRRTLTLLPLLLILMSCGEPLRVRDRSPGPVGTPLISQAARQTATALAGRTAAPGTGSPARTATPAVQSDSPEPPAATNTAPPTAAPTDTDAPTRATPAPVSPATPVVIVPATPVPQTSEQRWRAQQEDRQVLEERPLYTARSPVPLLWWDPATGQVLEIGLIRGDFPVQARFTFRPTGQPALEVPYRINADFGLTAVSEAVLQRLRAAGYTEFAETFVIVSDAVQPR